VKIVEIRGNKIITYLDGFNLRQYSRIGLALGGLPTAGKYSGGRVNA
jgi:hypothetical protein